MSKKVPQAPKSEVLTSEDSENLAGWIKYFKNLSDRIKLITPDSPGFLQYLSSVKRATTNFLRFDKDHILRDWPNEEEVAFIVLVDKSKPNQTPVLSIEDARVFCFNNYSFGTRYNFEWDGDSENDNGCKTYSLNNPNKWLHSSKMIKEEILELNQSVPKPPKLS